jgi:hypothetical protein
MARTYLVFGDIEGKLDVLRVECTKCDRKALQRGAGDHDGRARDRGQEADGRYARAHHGRRTSGA